MPVNIFFWNMKQDKLTRKTGQAQDKLHTDNRNIVKLVDIIGNNQLPLKMMMESVGLKGRDNFLNLYLNPAIRGGYVCLQYPGAPGHPRQKYMLTVKGLALPNEMASKNK